MVLKFCFLFVWGFLLLLFFFCPRQDRTTEITKGLLDSEACGQKRVRKYTDKTEKTIQTLSWVLETTLISSVLPLVSWSVMPVSVQFLSVSVSVCTWEHRSRPCPGCGIGCRGGWSDCARLKQTKIIIIIIIIKLKAINHGWMIIIIIIFDYFFAPRYILLFYKPMLLRVCE